MGIKDIQAVIKGGLYTTDTPAAATDTNATPLQIHTAEDMDINIIRTATAAQVDDRVIFLPKPQGAFQGSTEGAFLLLIYHSRFSCSASASRMKTTVLE